MSKIEHVLKAVHRLCEIQAQETALLSRDVFLSEIQHDLNALAAAKVDAIRGLFSAYVAYQEQAGNE